MKYAIILLLICTGIEVHAAGKKDFKGLFGSYRREKFTENEARSSDFGIDLMLSTLIPVTSVVKSSEDGSNFSDLYYSTFFNYELGAFYTLSYHWELYLNLGYYSYETRKENSTRDEAALPLFHQFDMEVAPLIIGTKYRLTTDDIVPYLGIGLGLGYVHRKGYYDYNSTAFNEQFFTAFMAQASAGVEFYFAPRAGLRLEMSCYYMALSSKQLAPGTPGIFPVISYQANPISLRYASGLFVLF